ncbi:MAG: DUF4293 domain-containing protein [Salinivirgaceae bacterium]|jgi:hypothetical protein
MLQRIQTLFIFIAIVLTPVLFLFPIAQFSADAQTVIFKIVSLESQQGVLLVATYPLLIISGLLAFLLIFQLVNFKKRIRQMQTGKAIIWLSVIWYVVAAIYVYNYFGTIDIIYNTTPHLALFVPVLLIVFVAFANKYIKKDEDLVRSIDRIR